jgi:hypothetical protein
MTQTSPAIDPCPHRIEVLAIDTSIDIDTVNALARLTAMSDPATLQLLPMR